MRGRAVTVGLFLCLSSCLNFYDGYLACVDAGRCPAGPDGGAGTGGGAPSEEQIVLQSVTTDTEDGSTKTQTDFLQSAFTLYVQNGTTFTQIAGSPDGAGRYRFSGVPAGHRYLRNQNLWLVDPSSEVDFSYRTFGRPDVTSVSGAVGLKVNVTGMDAWLEYTSLQLIVPNAQVALPYLENALVTPQVVGQVPQLLNIDYAKASTEAWGTPFPVPDTAKKDVAYLTQLDQTWVKGRTGEDVLVLWLAKSATLSSLTLGSGQSTTVSGTFTSPSATVRVDLRWLRESFGAMASKVTPKVVSDAFFDSCYVSVLPYGSDLRLDRAADLLITGAFNFSKPSSNLSFVQVVNNPYPQAWPTAVFLRHCAYGPLQATGGTKKYQPSACAGREEYLSAVNGKDLGPLIEPPTDFKVDGQSAYDSTTVSSNTPVFSWTAPSAGVDSYELEVYQVVDDGTNLVSSSRAFFITHGTSVMVPPGVLETGQYYYFVILGERGVDWLKTPWANALPYVYASGLSSVMKAQ